MYKLTKGIKKKVKGKKKPTEEELEQEELRQYRLEKQREQELREQEQRQKEEQGLGEEGEEDQAEEGAGSADAGGDSGKSQQKPAESDEWAKFRALTSGVDSVLSTTKESLQTIKETSYFIRKKPAAEQKAEKEKPAATDTSKPKWVDVDVEEESPESETELESAEAPAEESPNTPSPEKKRDLEEVLSEVERLERAQFFEEDVFNTEYVDAVKDINLAVIPDSPTDDGDDPFDTSAVEEVLREKPEEVRKKKLKAIALGKAVEVLSGAQKNTEKSEDQQEFPATAVPKKSRRRERGVYRRKGSLDLLETSENVVGSEDIRVTKSATVSPTEKGTAKTLLDEDIEDDGNFELNLAVTPEFHIPQLVPETTASKENSSPESQNNQISDIVSEFDTQSEVPKTGSNEVILTAKPPDENDLEFDSLATESLLRAKDREEIIGDDDPFDTSAITQVLGSERAADVANFNEEEVKFDADFGEAKSRPARPPPPVIITSPEKETPDLLTSNEHHDYEPLPDPIKFSAEPEKKQQSPEESQEEEIDPFDTSAAEKLVGTEIKLLERELLDSSNAPVTTQAAAPAAEEDEFDFDPRAAEEKPEPDPFDTSFAGGLVSESTVNAAELLASTPTQDSTPVVLPPQQAADSTSQAEIDPFDTSIADTFGNVELKVLESELLTTPEPAATTDLAKKLDLSATSAPPRPPPPAPKAEAAFPVSFDEVPEAKPAPHPELLTLTPEEEHAAPVALVPQRPGEEAAAEELDPFDTSIADKFGTAEVSVLEQELLGASPAPAAKQLTELLPSLTDELDSETVSVSKPVQEKTALEEERDVFDTSYVESAGIASSSEVDGASFTKPSSLSVSESSAALLASTPEDPNPLLQPVSANGGQSNAEEIDPFDTSAAEQFGHTELRVLESELLGDVRCSQQPPVRPAPPRPVPPRPAPPAQLPAALPVPSADELLAVTPSAEQLPTLQPRADAPPPRPLSPVALDPFDTSIADRYGTTELRVLEQEFAGDGAASPALKRAVSDPDFDPRGEEKVARPATPPAAAPVECLLDTDTGAAAPVQTLTASVVSAPVAAEPEEIDPFDTSIAESLVPGKGEILALERELLHS